MEAAAMGPWQQRRANGVAPDPRKSPAQACQA
jgi:hypothetical protein